MEPQTNHYRQQLSGTLSPARGSNGRQWSHLSWKAEIKHQRPHAPPWGAKALGSNESLDETSKEVEPSRRHTESSEQRASKAIHQPQPSSKREDEKLSEQSLYGIGGCNWASEKRYQMWEDPEQPQVDPSLMHAYASSDEAYSDIRATSATDWEAAGTISDPGDTEDKTTTSGIEASLIKQRMAATPHLRHPGGDVVRHEGDIPKTFATTEMQKPKGDDGRSLGDDTATSDSKAYISLWCDAPRASSSRTVRGTHQVAHIRHTSVRVVNQLGQMAIKRRYASHSGSLEKTHQRNYVNKKCWARKTTRHHEASVKRLSRNCACSCRKRSKDLSPRHGVQ